MSTPTKVLLDATVTTTIAKSGLGPRQHLIDVSFASAAVPLHCISFYNYYCAAITISHTNARTDHESEQQGNANDRSAMWQLVVPRLSLMANPHCEVCQHCLSFGDAMHASLTSTCAHVWSG
jgi:hypothetical protein